MASGGAGETAAGNLRRARISDVCCWVKRSWENISTQTIIRSFEKCGITGNLDRVRDFDKENTELEVIVINDNETA